jgi:hypothetical protein
VFLRCVLAPLPDSPGGGGGGGGVRKPARPGGGASVGSGGGSAPDVVAGAAAATTAGDAAGATAMAGALLSQAEFAHFAVESTLSTMILDAGQCALAFATAMRGTRARVPAPAAGTPDAAWASTQRVAPFPKVRRWLAAAQ